MTKRVVVLAGGSPTLLFEMAAAIEVFVSAGEDRYDVAVRTMDGMPVSARPPSKQPQHPA